MKTMIYSVFAFMLSASALTACSDEKFSGDPSKDWDGTTTFFASTDAPDFGTYYMPYGLSQLRTVPATSRSANCCLMAVTTLSRMLRSALAVLMRKMVHIISIIQVIMATARTVRW